MSTWKELKKDLVLTQEDLNAIELEKELIRTMIHIREEKGLTQSQLAEMCNVPLKTVGRKTHPTVSLALQAAKTLLNLTTVFDSGRLINSLSMPAYALQAPHTALHGPPL